MSQRSLPKPVLEEFIGGDPHLCLVTVSHHPHTPGFWWPEKETGVWLADWRPEEPT